MTRPGFTLCVFLYVLIVVIALAIGALEPWQAILAWSLAVIVDALLRVIPWLVDRRDRR